MDQLLQLVHSHIAISHGAALVVGGLILRFAWPQIEKDEEAVALKGLVLARERLKALGGSDADVNAVEAKIAVLAQNIINAAQQDQAAHQGEQPK